MMQTLGYHQVHPPVHGTTVVEQHAAARAASAGATGSPVLSMSQETLFFLS